MRGYRGSLFAGIALWGVLLTSDSVFAKGSSEVCNLRLGVSAKAVLPREAGRQRHELRVSEADYLKIVDLALAKYFAKGRHAEDAAIVYYSLPDYLDRGFKVSFGGPSRGRLEVKSVAPLRFSEERAHFEAEAVRRGLSPLYVQMRIELLGHRTIGVSPYVQLKLTEKHNVSREEMIEALNSRDPSSLRQVDSPRGLEYQDRYEIYGRTARGRRLRLIVALDQRQQTVNLISAYDDRH